QRDVAPDTVRAADRLSFQVSSPAPRLLRPRLAAAYLGMNKNNFNRLVRPSVHEIPLGKRAIAFDRLELDAWTEEYCRRNGRPTREEGRLCRDEKCQASTNESVPTAASNGRSISASRGMDAFARALERATMTKQRGISRAGSRRFEPRRSMESDRRGRSEKPP